MSNSNIILKYLEDNRPSKYCDDCISDQVGIKHRASVNQICNRLSRQGTIRRDKGLCALCHRQKFVNAFDQSLPGTSGESSEMGRVLLLDAVRQLETSLGDDERLARPQAVSQFNALLEVTKSHYPHRADIQAISAYSNINALDSVEFRDAVRRLRSALDLRPPGSSVEILAQIQLPPNATAQVKLDFEELQKAASHGLRRSALLLAGLIAEALLLLRHPDRSDRGPGLRQLVGQARQLRLFGRDTLRQLDTLIDYRDLIHPRAQVRNKIRPNDARIEVAATALKLLCTELEDPDIRYDSPVHT